MKWTLIIVGLFIFGYWIVPLLFHAMKKHDYDTLFHGMRDARIAGGSFHDSEKPYLSYTDKYMRGDVRR